MAAPLSPVTCGPPGSLQRRQSLFFVHPFPVARRLIGEPTPLVVRQCPHQLQLPGVTPLQLASCIPLSSLSGVWVHGAEPHPRQLPGKTEARTPPPHARFSGHSIPCLGVSSSGASGPQSCCTEGWAFEPLEPLDLRGRSTCPMDDLVAPHHPSAHPSLPVPWGQCPSVGHSVC